MANILCVDCSPQDGIDFLGVWQCVACLLCGPDNCGSSGLKHNKSGRSTIRAADADAQREFNGTDLFGSLPLSAFLSGSIYGGAKSRERNRTTAAVAKNGELQR